METVVSAEAPDCPAANLDPPLHFRARAISSAVLVVVSVLTNLLVAPTFEILNVQYEPLAYVAFFAFGMIFGQGAALAAWLVWGEGPLMRRLVIHWGIAAVLCWLWIAGLFVVEHGDSFLTARYRVALALPLISLSAQLPLWLMREAFGWRLVRGNELATSDARRLTIRGLLVATLVVAVSLALARSMVSTDVDNSEFWLAWAIGSGILMAFSAAAVLPAAAMLLGRWPLRRGMLATGGYAVTAITIMWTIATTLYFTYPAALAPGFLFGWITAMIAGCAVTLILAGIAARSHGYHLAFRSRSRA